MLPRDHRAQGPAPPRRAQAHVGGFSLPAFAAGCAAQQPCFAASIGGPARRSGAAAAASRPGAPAAAAAERWPSRPAAAGRPWCLPAADAAEGELTWLSAAAAAGRAALAAAAALSLAALGARRSAPGLGRRRPRPGARGLGPRPPASASPGLTGLHAQSEIIEKRDESLSLDSYPAAISSNELLYGVVPYSWEEVGLHPTLIEALKRWKPKAITKPTHIQADTLRKTLRGRDLVIQAETGSGKTLAYMLPAAQKAVLWAEEKAPRPRGEEQELLEDELPEDRDGAEAGASAEPQQAMCYRVEHPVGPEGIRCVARPDDIAPWVPVTLHRGDEFMARSVDGSPFSVEYIELADGRGWVPWDRQNLRLRLALSAVEFRVGQRVQAKVELKYGSGDVVAKGAAGVVERVLPLVGVRWDGVKGLKAVREPRRSLRDEEVRTTGKGHWARAAPNFIFVTATRELCEQVAATARQLGALLPEEAQAEWTVATALGEPPGPRKGLEQWPFPMGEKRPKVLVATVQFLGYFFHRKHMALWGNVHYIAYDEVDYLLTAPERKMLYRIKTMLARCKKRYEGCVMTQQVAACSMLPTQGRHSAFLRLQEWMPGALRAAPRTALLHKSHPLVSMKWQYVPRDFEAKVERLVEDLKNRSSVRKRKDGQEEYLVRHKTIIFVNKPSTGMELAEALATGHNICQVGLFISHIGADARRERLEMFRRGKIKVMVCTDVLSRGIDIPDLRHMVQFEFASNVTFHIGRVGRVSRAGRCGYALNFYDSSKGGNRLLAESIQYLGDQPLDGLFSRKGGFSKALRENQRYRKELLMQNLPLPPHLRGPEKREVPLLTAVLEGTADVAGGIDGGGDGAEEGEWLAEVGGDQEEEEEEDFEGMTAKEKDAAYLEALGEGALEGDYLEAAAEEGGGGLLSDDGEEEEEE